MNKNMTLQEKTNRRIELLKQSVQLLKEEIQARNISIDRIEELIGKLEKA